MKIIFKTSTPKGVALKEYFNIKLINLLNPRPFDHFVLQVQETRFRVSVWSLPHPSLQDGGHSINSESYDIAEKHVFGRVLDCKVVEKKVFVISDSGTFSILQVETIDSFPTSHGSKVTKAAFRVSFQITLDALSDRKALEFNLAIDKSCGSFLLSSHNQLKRYNLEGKVCRLSDTYYDLGIVERATYLVSDSSIKFVLLNKDKNDSPLSLTLFKISSLQSTTRYMPFSFSTGHNPRLIIPLPEIPESFIVITNSSVIFFDTNSTIDALEPTRYCTLEFPNNEENAEILIADCVIDNQNSKYGLQYLYLVSERGDIFQGSICWTPFTISLVYLGQCPNSTQKCLLLPSPTDSMSYLACFGSHCDGTIMLIYERKYALVLEPPFILQNPPPISECFVYTVKNDMIPGGKGVIGDCLITMSKRVDNGILTRQTYGLNAFMKSKYFDLEDGITGMWPIEIEGFYLVVVSFVSESRVLRFLDPLFTDYTSESGIIDYAQTINIFSMDECMLQVFKTGMNVSIYSPEELCFSYYKSFEFGSQGEVTDCAAHENFVFLAIGSRILVFKILADPSALAVSFVNVQTLELEEQICCLYIFSKDERIIPFPLCFVGTSAMTVKIFSLNLILDSGSIVAWREITLPQSISIEFYTPYALYLYSSTFKTFLLCSASNGDFIVFDWEVMGSDVYISPPSRFTDISELPVSFCHHPYENYLVVMTDRAPLKIIIGSNGLEFEPILLEKADYAVPLPMDHLYLMALNSKMLAVVQLDLHAQILLEKFPQKNSPCKIAFDPSTRCFLVVTESKSSGGSVKSIINLVDPTSNQILAAKQLSDHETIECMTIWNVKKRYICVGTSGYRESGGRILVLTLKNVKGKDGVANKFYQLSDLAFSQGVTAITSTENYIFAACGSQIAQIKIRADTRQIMLGATCSSRNPAKAIKTSTDYDLFVAGSKDSLCHFKFSKTDKKIQLLGADSIPKQAIDLWVFHDTDDGVKLAVCIFKSGAVAGYRSERRKLELLFHFSLNDTPLKIFPMTIQKQFSVLAKDQAEISVSFQAFDIPWDQSSNEALVIVTKSNLRCSMLRLTDQLYCLLKEVQDIMQAYPATRPILGGDINEFESSECGEKLNALNADFLVQFLELTDYQKQEICSKFKVDFRFKDSVLVSQGEQSLSNVCIGPKEVDTIIYRLCRSLV